MRLHAFTRFGLHTHTHTRARTHTLCTHTCTRTPHAHMHAHLVWTHVCRPGQPETAACRHAHEAQCGTAGIWVVVVVVRVCERCSAVQRAAMRYSRLASRTYAGVRAGRHTVTRSHPPTHAHTHIRGRARACPLAHPPAHVVHVAVRVHRHAHAHAMAAMLLPVSVLIRCGKYKPIAPAACQALPLHRCGSASIQWVWPWYWHG